MKEGGGERSRRGRKEEDSGEIEMYYLCGCES